MNELQSPALEIYISFPHVIKALLATELSLFYRKLFNKQVQHLNKWIKNDLYLRELLGAHWPADFNSDGVIKKSRTNWGILDPIPSQEQFLTHQSCEQLMAMMLWTPVSPAIGLSDNELPQLTVTPVDPVPLDPVPVDPVPVVCPTPTEELQSRLCDNEKKMDDTGPAEFKLLEIENLITRKDEKIETLELEVKHLRARVALLDGRLKRLGKK